MYFYFCADIDCFGRIFTVYDFFQLLGAFSLVTFLFFVRSQYLRVEQVMYYHY